MKICLTSSTGGHLAELKKIMPAVAGHDYFFVVESSQMSRSLEEGRTVYYLAQQERNTFRFYFTFLKNTMRSLRVLVKEKPSLIITTGAGAVFPICFIGKLLGKRIVYIESFAKISSPSLTGKLIYKFADEFYIQWESLRAHYPNAKYRGSLY